MDANSTVLLSDLSSLSQEELVEAYEKLSVNYLQIKKVNESIQQEAYELRRNLQTAQSAENYLSQELELAISSQNVDIKKIRQKHNEEFDEYKKQYANIQASNLSMQAQLDEFRVENDDLRRKMDELGKAISTPHITVCDESFLEKGLLLEKENFALLERIEKYQENESESLSTISTQMRQIKVFTEQIDCLEENLQSKREELEEKAQLLESAQERMIEMNAELAALKSTPDNQSKKGNSLFAEVDDQRQAMKQLLATQKKHYLHMKKVYNESEHEIRRLKRENAAMHDELHVCSSMFLNADKTYKEKLTETIRQLIKQNEESEQKLVLTQKQLVSMADQKGINWLDSMFNYCKQETDGLKEQLHSCRMQKNTLEGTLRNSQQDLAKWRFESLKSRCIIIDRETLLEENNISFQPIKTSDVNITEANLKNAVPHISSQSRRKSQSLEREMRRVSLELSTSLNANAKNKSNINSPNNGFKINCGRQKIESICPNSVSTIKQELDSSNIVKSQPNPLTIQCEKPTNTANRSFDIYEDKTSDILRIAVKTQNINLDSTTKDDIENCLNELPQTTKSIISPCRTLKIKSTCSNDLSYIKHDLDTSIVIKSSKPNENTNNIQCENLTYTESNLFDIYEDKTFDILRTVVKAQNINLNTITKENVENDLYEFPQSIKSVVSPNNLSNIKQDTNILSKSWPPNQNVKTISCESLKYTGNNSFDIYEDKTSEIPRNTLKTQTINLDTTLKENIENVPAYGQCTRSMASSLMENEELYNSKITITPKNSLNQIFEIYEDNAAEIPLKMIKNSSKRIHENKTEAMSDFSLEDFLSSQADNSFKIYENSICNISDNDAIGKIFRRTGENNCFETDKCSKPVDLELSTFIDQENSNIMGKGDTIHDITSHVPQYRDIIFTEEDYKNLSLKLSLMDSKETHRKSNVEFNEQVNNMRHESILQKNQNVINHVDDRKSVHFSESVEKSDQEKKSIKKTMRKKPNITVKRIVFPKKLE